MASNDKYTSNQRSMMELRAAARRDAAKAEKEQPSKLTGECNFPNCDCLESEECPDKPGRAEKEQRQGEPSASEAQPLDCENCNGKIVQRQRGSTSEWVHVANNRFWCEGGHAKPKVEAQREEEPQPLQKHESKEIGEISHRVMRALFGRGIVVDNTYWTKWRVIKEVLVKPSSRAILLPKSSAVEMPEPLVSDITLDVIAAKYPKEDAAHQMAVELQWWRKRWAEAARKDETR